MASDIVTNYVVIPIEISDPLLLFRINQRYRYGMSESELYEVTRGVWKLGGMREYAEFALAVFQGIVMEVYSIESWHPAGSTPYQTRSITDVSLDGRWEFLGRVAPDCTRNRYFGHSVADYWKKGARNPIAYVNIEK